MSQNFDLEPLPEYSNSIDSDIWILHNNIIKIVDEIKRLNDYINDFKKKVNIAYQNKDKSSDYILEEIRQKNER